VNAFHERARRFLLKSWRDEQLRAGELLWSSIGEGLAGDPVLTGHPISLDRAASVVRCSAGALARWSVSSGA